MEKAQLNFRSFADKEDGEGLGVISSTDILRHLREPLTVTFEHVELLATDGLRDPLADGLTD